MNSKKIFTNNDVYSIDIVSNKIVINDNYEGFIILDSNLNIEKAIKVMDDMILYTSYSYTKNNMIVYCCYDTDDPCLVYLDVNTYEFKIVYLEQFKEIVFLRLYYWDNNELILLDYNENELTLYQVDIQNGTIKKVNHHAALSEHKTVFDDWSYLHPYGVYKVYPYIHCAVIEDNGSLHKFDYSTGTKTVLEIERINFHDIEIGIDSVTQISQDQVLVWHDGKSISLFPSSDEYSFYRAKLIMITGDEYLVLLSHSMAKSSLSQIDMYCLSSLFG